MAIRGPKSYSSIEEFEREEIRVSHKIGWSIDDLFQEASLNSPEESSNEPEELDFD